MIPIFYGKSSLLMVKWIFSTDLHERETLKVEVPSMICEELLMDNAYTCRMKGKPV